MADGNNLPTPTEVRHMVIGLHETATTWEEQGMTTLATANRAIAGTLQALSDALAQTTAELAAARKVNKAVSSPGRLTFGVEADDE